MPAPSRSTTVPARPSSRRTPAPGTGRKAALRLGDDLLERARRAGEACHRSVPNQIEYWAALGRRLEGALGARQIAELLSDEAFIEHVRLGRATVPDVDELLAGLHADRASGALAAQFDDDPVVYDTAPASRSLIRRRNADGSIELGTYTDEGFVPVPDTAEAEHRQG